MVKTTAVFVRSSCSSVPLVTSSNVSASSLATNGMLIILWSSGFSKIWLSLALKYLIRTHIMFPNSWQINKLLNIVLRQDIRWTNARSLKDSGRSECSSRKNNKTWCPGYDWLSSTLCSSNFVVDVFNSDCASTPAIIKIITPSTRRQTNTYSYITRTTRCLTKIFKFLLWSWL